MKFKNIIKFLGTPFKPYSSDDHLRLVYTDNDHQPYNKRAHEYDKSRVTLTLDRCEGHWVSFLMTETTTSKQGRTASRDIYVTVTKDVADKIGKFILTGKTDADNQQQG